MKCCICKKTKFNSLERNLFDDRYGYSGKYSVMQCKNCSLAQTYPRLEKNELPKIYSQYYPLASLTPRQVENSVSKLGKVGSWLIGIDNVAHKHIKPHNRVLDIGSGSGVSLLEIKAGKSAGYGVEPDPMAQKLASALKLKVFKGEITDNPFPQIKFNAVTASQVIEHVPDPVMFIIAATKKLLPNGKIILSTPNLDSLIRKVLGHKWLHWHVPYHQNYFNRRSIQLLAEKTGLKIIKIRTITPNLWTILQIQSLFNKTPEGVPSPVWSNSQTISHKNRARDSHLYFVYKLILIFVIILLIPINRAIDAVGIGESLLIFLKKK